MNTRRPGQDEPCPLCGARAGIQEDADGYACLSCGGPRVLVAERVERAYPEKAFLEQAKLLKLRRAAWGVAAGVSTAVGLAATALASALALFVDYGAGARLATFVVLLGALSAAVIGFVNVRRTSKSARAALADAEGAVAGELYRVRPDLTPEQLAGLLRVGPDRARELAARHQVERMLTEGAEAPRLRVPDEAEPEPEPAAEAAGRTRTVR